MKNILFIYGTRPEAIKLFPLIAEAKKELSSNIFVLCTGQHKSLTELYELFDIYPDLSLDLQRDSGSLSELSSLLIREIDKVISDFNPNLVFVHGDTSSSFMGALGAFYNNKDIAHIEAGLRTFNMLSPFPEEANRVFISKIAKYNFCPTKISQRNLLNEKISKNKIHIVGNTVIDSVLQISKLIKNDLKIENELNSQFKTLLNFEKIILITIHRRENWGKNINEILQAFKDMSNKYDNYSFIFSTHPNPNLQKAVRKSLGDKKNIFILEPQNYINFIFLMMSSDMIFTDSGGIQEEATAINKKVMVLREMTERPEALDTGLVKVIGVKQKAIKDSFKSISAPMKKICYPFGRGNASTKIIKIIKEDGY